MSDQNPAWKTVPVKKKAGSNASPPEPGRARADGGTRRWRINRRRLRWYLASLALLLIDGLWFFGLQDPLPHGPARPVPPSPGWWLHPVEFNPAMKLAGFRGVRFRDLSFANERDGWIVGDRGLILRTRDGGLSWTAQTNILWNAPRQPKVAPAPFPL